MAEIKEVVDSVEALVIRSGLVIQRVDSPELLEQVMRLRYQVYCKERNFIKPQTCTNEVETDKYDPYAIHFVASDKYGVIGAMRLVLDSPYGFPFEEYCRGKLFIGSDEIMRKDAAEISRFVISKSFRRRLFTGGIKPIALGLYRAMYIETKSRGLKYWYALMERSLHKLLGRYAFDFKPIGEKVDVYGMVMPYLANVEEVDEALQERFPFVVKK